MPRWKVRWNQSPLAFAAFRLQHLPSTGWEPVSLCLHGDPRAGPQHTYYTSVWVERETAVDYHVQQLGTVGETYTFIAQEAATHQPVIVTGQSGMFATVVKRNAPLAQVLLNSPIAPAEPGGSDGLPYATRVPLWIDVWQDASGPHFTFVYEKVGGAQPEPLASWNAYQFHRSQAEETFDAMTRGFARPDLICSLQGGNPLYFAVFRDEPIDGYFVCNELSALELSITMDGIKSPEVGGWPLRVHARGEPGQQQRFTLIGARYPHDRPAARVATASRPSRVAPFSSSPEYQQGTFKGTPPSYKSAPMSEANSGGGQAFEKLPWGAGGAAHQMEAPVLGASNLGPEKTTVSPSSQFGGAATKMEVTVLGGTNLAPDKVTVSPFSPLDKYFISLMKQFGMRALQVAVARGGKLMHAPAFTWAEPGYPITTPTTRMRLASISKLITTLGVVRAWEMLNMPMSAMFDQNVNIASLLGYANPTDPRFKLRTVGNLLTHTAALLSDPGKPPEPTWAGLLPRAPWVANQLLSFHGGGGMAPWPLTTKEYTEFVLTHPGVTGGLGWFTSYLPEHLPTTQDSGYSGLGMVLAAELVRKLLAFHAYAQWDYARIMTDVPGFFFKRLGIERARPTNTDSILAQGDITEVRYHPSVPKLAPSVRSEDVSFSPTGEVASGRLSPVAYEPKVLGWGISNGDWAMAASDLAKVVSSLDVPVGQTGSLFDKQATLDAALFGWASNRSLVFWTVKDATGAFTVETHNGGYDGTGGVVWRRQYSGGSPPIVVVMLGNLDVKNWNLLGDNQLFSDVHQIVDNIPENRWPTADLFPHVGIKPPVLS